VPHCHLATRPNGFDAADKRLSFACFKTCLKSKGSRHRRALPQLPHRLNRLGFATHSSIVQHPRLILEIPRGSERYRELHCLRSTSERTNSSLKDDNAIFHDPPVRTLRRAAVLSLLAVTTTLLERVTSLSWT
jgi:hypothetical protein